MRIAMVVSGFPTLSETFILYQITGLLDMGHDVMIVSFRRPRGGPVHPEVEQYGLLARTHYVLPQSRAGLLPAVPASVARLLLRHPRTFLSLMGLMPQRAGLPRASSLIATDRLPRLLAGCDIVHCHFGPNALKTLPAALIARRPLVVSFHGHDVNRFMQVRGGDAYACLSGFPHGIGFTANSSYTSTKAVAAGCDAARLAILPEAVKTDDIAFRARTSPPKGEPVRALTVARLVEKKGLEYSIKAVAALRPRYPQLRYDIIGEGPLRPSLEALIEATGSDGVVRLRGAGSRSDILLALSQAHLFVLSSVTAADGDAEGQGVVLQEAQAAGLPVIATKHNGFPDSVLPGESAFLVAERDVDALAERLGHLLDNPQLWPAMGTAGRRFVEERFDIRRINERLVRIYENVIGGARRVRACDDARQRREIARGEQSSVAGTEG